MKKFIAPGSWFAFSYPDTWFEFSEEPDCFLFYNPEKWEGNFRISAYRDTSASFAFNYSPHKMPYTINFR